ncbi:MAG TPA: carbohydrate-binding protein, partial [Candidatus Paceibacterota bacterium]|nr:carbohydrate-binding protein [Candidatus Paceibacterota bacterium]
AKVKAEFATDNKGNVFFDAANLTAPLVYPTIDNLYPNGTNLMQASGTLSFTAASAATTIAPANIVVTLNGVNISANLNITGTASSRNVVYAGLKTNRTYTVSIQVTDAGGLVTTRSATFDTFQPGCYTWEAEDFDHDGGQFIDNPQTNAYFGLSGIAEVDYHETSTGTNSASWAYRPWTDPNTAVPQTQVAADIARSQYAGTNDFNIGWWDSGEWQNYTRTFPSGLFNVYARMASPGAASVSLAEVTSGLGTTEQTTVALGGFQQQGGLGWDSFSWVPLTDASGNLVKLNLGGVKTLRATTGGNANLNFLMLVPADTNLPAITGLYPDGATLMQATNTLRFTATSAAGINTGSISVTLSVTNATLHYTTNLTGANGLVIGGTANSRTVSYPGLISNAVYRAVVSVTDINNNTVTISPKFDTYSPVLTWEAEDFDYNGGQFINNPPVDAYAGLIGFEGVDYHDSNLSGGRVYRPGDTASTDLAGDVARVQYLSPATNDYAVGWFVPGEWMNYTRTIPAGTYNIYGRFASGSGDGVQSLSVVTNGAGTGSQEAKFIGNFNTANTGGWTTYQYFPMRDQFGNLAAVTLNGQTTFRLDRVSGSDANDNFFMLLPAETGLPTITQVSPTGWMQSTNKLTFVAASASGIATSNITVALNGAVAGNVSFTGSATSWAASVPLAPGMVYSAAISVQDNNAQMASTTVSFDTLSADNYTLEAEDFDYDSGLFFDNPQVNGYLGFGGVEGIDFHDSTNGGGAIYRIATVATEICGDLVRPQYSGTGNADYDVGYTATGEWLNFTRTYPTGKFNVYLRAARGTGGTSPMGLQQVTGGWGAASQTTVSLGSFNITDTGGWQTYRWTPLTDGSGKLVTVSLGGTNTLRLTDGGANLNFLMLSPALVLDATVGGGTLTLRFGTQPGFNYTIQYTDNLAGGSWSELSTVAGDGSSKTVNASTTLPGRFYRLQVH